MRTVAVSFLGEDRPGIMHAVSAALASLSCNIAEVSQTILRSESAAIVIAATPDGLALEDMKRSLDQALAPFGGMFTLKELHLTPGTHPTPGQPYVITLSGGDRLGLIAEMTGVISAFGVSIANLKAITRQDEPGRVIIVFEVDLPASVDQAAFRQGLARKGEELDVDVSVQHRDIFEAIHRI
jgi:glycine cleavage system transcriptional repressor